jgi:two-component system chemotaxis sensor kinase CheA
MEDIFQKFKKQFIEEILALLEQLEKDLLVLENEPEDRQLIDSVFRAMHTIKGTSAMYGIKPISEFTHHLESIYQSIRDGKMPIGKEIIDISLESLDHIRHLTEDEVLKNPDNIVRHQELLESINSYHPIVEEHVAENRSDVIPSQPTDENENTWYILLRTDEQIFFRGVSIVNILTDLSLLGMYHIHRIPALSDSTTETWGILLITSFSLNEIKEVFMFIEDNCSFVLVKEGNLLEPGENKLVVSQTPPINVEEKEQPTFPEKEILVEESIQEIKDEKPEEKKKLKSVLLFADASKHNLKRISVDSVKLDYLMYLVSELITLNSQLLETTKDEYYERIRPQIEQMESLAKLFRNNALEIRLVPLGDLVLKFQRLIRDLSKQLDKKIDFVTQGTDTELDKNTIDLVAEPIIHIIRNCVDHGIETPDERVKKGKSPTGTVKLTAHHVGNYIHIRIEDDGAGLNLDKIRNKAIEQGIIKGTDTLTKSEITNLIFHSGFSTSDKVTEVSGRGVGMDVVKRKIAELRGEILVDTEKDKGTVFTLKIQQSVAIIDTLLFRVHNSYFILPLTEIEICVHTEKSYIERNQSTNTIEYNEMMIPYLDLRSMFNLGGEYPEMVKTLVLQEEKQYFGILCDEILGEQQAVLKPLGQAFDNSSGILAVTQHGDGKWAYMLNTHFMHQRLKDSSSKLREII